MKRKMWKGRAMPEASVGTGRKGAMPEPMSVYQLWQMQMDGTGSAYHGLDTERTFPYLPRAAAVVAARREDYE